MIEPALTIACMQAIVRWLESRLARVGGDGKKYIDVDEVIVSEHSSVMVLFLHL